MTTGSPRHAWPAPTSRTSRGRRTAASFSLFRRPLRPVAICSGGQSVHFFLDRPRNNGLDADLRKSDGGIGDLTLRTTQVGLFKSPSLRNVEFTAPYMHDGRFKTLEEVVEHYSKGIKRHPNLDGRLRRPLNFDTRQKASLVAFLKTLSDHQFVTDPKFSDPFQ